MTSWIPKGFHIKAPRSDSHINFLIKLFAKVTQSAILGTILHQHAISFHLHHQLHLYIKCPDFMKGTTLLLYELLQLVLFYYIKSDMCCTDGVNRSYESLWHPNEELGANLQIGSPLQTIFQKVDMAL